MKKPETELSRPIDVARIPQTGCDEVVTADPEERACVARRLGLPAIHRLTADLALSRWRGEGAKVMGTIAAEVEQICVVTLEPFRTGITETVERYFLPDGGTATDDADVDVLEGGVIDLGEVVVESLTLAIDPYPRKPGAVFEDRGDPGEPDESDEKHGSPFAALSALRSGKR
jgi:uncharacterized metal-binding protein YceD (DUF177 family)